MKKGLLPTLIAGGILLIMVVSISWPRISAVFVHEDPHSTSPLKLVTTTLDFEKAIDSPRLAVFDLYADWCGPCKVLRPTLEELAKKYGESVDFYRVNVDASPQIAATFRTSGIPHVVFVKDKSAISSLVGVNPRESYEKVIATCATAPGANCEKLLSAL